MSDARSSIDPDALLRETPWLHALARGLVRDEHEAEDVVQSAVMTAITHPPRESRALRSWLGRVTRRLAIRKGQQRTWRARRERSVARGEEEVAAVDVVARTELFRRLVDFVLELEEPYRTTVLLRYFEDVVPAEIAKRQDVPVATVHTRLRRALDRLRERLDRDSGGRETWRAILAVPPAPIVAAGVVTGGLVMATHTKVAMVAVIALIASVVGWRVTRHEDASPAIAKDERVAPQTPVPAEVAAAAPAAPALIVPKRVEEPAAPATSRPATVSGLIVDDRTSDPVAGAEVAAFVDLEDLQPEATATTGPDGHFALATSRHPGVVLARLRVFDKDHVPWNANNRVYPNGKDQVKGNDIGTIRLLRGAQISGRVLTAQGRQPVAGAALFVWDEGIFPGKPIFKNTMPAGVSGSDGTFTLTRRVGPTRAPAPVLALHPTGLDWAFLSVLPETEQVPGIEILAREGYSIGVTVVDEQEKTVEGATVFVMPRFPPLGDVYPAIDWVTEPEKVPKDGALGQLAERFLHVSDRTGGARFAGLPEARVEPVDGRYPSDAVDVFAFKAGFDPGRARFKAAPAGQSMKIILRQPRPFEITGVVRKADRSPIADATAEVRDLMKLEPIRAKTNAAGEYRITLEKAPFVQGVPDVTVSAAGFSEGRQSYTFEPGKQIKLDFELLPALTIAGRVVDDTGAIVSGIVYLYDTMSRSHRVDLVPDGTFAFKEADSKEWRVDVQPAKTWERPRVRLAHGGDYVEVVVQRAVTGTATVDAEIVDAETGAPIDPASATLSSRSGFAGDGYYPPQPTLSPGHVRAEGIPAGAWRLYVHTARYGRREHEFTIASADENVRLRIEIGKPGVIVARVILDDLPLDLRSRGVSLSVAGMTGVSVTGAGKIAPNAPPGAGVASAANDWTCRFEVVTAGVPIRIVADSGGKSAALAEQTVTLTPGEEKTVELRLALGGVARFNTSKPVHAGIVFLDRDSTGQWREIARVAHEKDEPWRYRHERRPGPFRWRVELWPLDASPRLRVPKVVEGEATIEARKTIEIPVAVPE